MPLSKYYDGKGEEVMAQMKKKYGDKKGEQIFYATHNKKKKGHHKTAASKKSLVPQPVDFNVKAMPRRPQLSVESLGRNVETARANFQGAAGRFAADNSSANREAFLQAKRMLEAEELKLRNSQIDEILQKNLDPGATDVPRASVLADLVQEQRRNSSRLNELTGGGVKGSSIEDLSIARRDLAAAQQRAKTARAMHAAEPSDANRQAVMEAERAVDVYQDNVDFKLKRVAPDAYKQIKKVYDEANAMIEGAFDPKLSAAANKANQKAAFNQAIDHIKENTKDLVEASGKRDINEFVQDLGKKRYEGDEVAPVARSAAEMENTLQRFNQNNPYGRTSSIPETEVANWHYTDPDQMARVLTAKPKAPAATAPAPAAPAAPAPAEAPVTKATPTKHPNKLYDMLTFGQGTKSRINQAIENVRKSMKTKETEILGLVDEANALKQRNAEIDAIIQRNAGGSKTMPEAELSALKKEFDANVARGSEISARADAIFEAGKKRAAKGDELLAKSDKIAKRQMAAAGTGAVASGATATGMMMHNDKVKREQAEGKQPTTAPAPTDKPAAQPAAQPDATKKTTAPNAPDAKAKALKAAGIAGRYAGGAAIGAAGGLAVNELINLIRNKKFGSDAGLAGTLGAGVGLIGAGFMPKQAAEVEFEPGVKRRVMHKVAGVIKAAACRKHARGKLAEKIRNSKTEGSNPHSFQVMDADESVGTAPFAKRGKTPNASIEKEAGLQGADMVKHDHAEMVRRLRAMLGMAPKTRRISEEAARIYESIGEDPALWEGHAEEHGWPEGYDLKHARWLVSTEGKPYEKWPKGPTYPEESPLAKAAATNPGVPGNMFELIDYTIEMMRKEALVKGDIQEGTQQIREDLGDTKKSVSEVGEHLKALNEKVDRGSKGLVGAAAGVPLGAGLGMLITKLMKTNPDAADYMLGILLGGGGGALAGAGLGSTYGREWNIGKGGTVGETTT